MINLYRFIPSILPCLSHHCSILYLLSVLCLLGSSFVICMSSHFQTPMLCTPFIIWLFFVLFFIELMPYIIILSETNLRILILLTKHKNTIRYHQVSMLASILFFSDLQSRIFEALQSDSTKSKQFSSFPQLLA